MMRNPFETLCFTKDLLEQFRGVRGGPDALLKIAEVHRKYLLIRWHPDRVIGGTEKAAEITQAFEEIKDTARREEYIEQFLAPTPDSLSREFFREDLGIAKCRIADLERQYEKVEQESRQDIGAFKEARALFAQKLAEVYQNVIFPALLKNGEGTNYFWRLSELPERFVAVVRETPRSYYATLFLVCRYVIRATRRVRTIKGKESEKQNRERIVSIETAVEMLQRDTAASGSKQEERIILGTADLKNWGTQMQSGGDSVVVPVQLLSEYLVKIENEIRIGSLVLTGYQNKRKRRYLDSGEFVFFCEGYLESIHPF